MVAPVVAAAAIPTVSAATWQGGTAVAKASAATTTTVAGKGGVALATEGSMSKLLAMLDSPLTKMKKALNKLAEASPALKQQMIILKKSVMLFLRPIGDIIAKFVRPAMVWLIKVAMKWYQLLTGRGGGQPSDLGDLKEGLMSELESAKITGDEVREAEIRAKIAAIDEEILKQTEAVAASLKMADAAINPIGAIISASIRFAGEKIRSFFTEGGWEDLKDNIGAIWDDYFVGPFETLKGELSKIWDDFLGNAWQDLKDKLEEIWDDYFDPGLDSVKEFADMIWESFFKVGFASVKNWGTDLWTMIKAAFEDLISSIKQWARDKFKPPKDPVNDDKDEPIGTAAFGIKNVRTTGMYKLHAGETVMNAGDTSRSQQSTRNININNTFNIPTTELDDEGKIRRLAKKLAALTEVELRRRTLYQ